MQKTNSIVLNPGVLTGSVQATPQTNFSVKAWRRISSYRLTIGWLVLAVWFVSIFALDWDGQWHAQVGRDGFWTPPHWLFYSSVALAGVLCLGLVLVETVLYRRHFPGVTDQTTTSVLFLFRGPVGFILTGFGALVMLISAPFDDYWHRIYGIDLKIWTPFHTMLLLGINLASLGLVYLFASEVNRRRLINSGAAKTVQSNSPLAYLSQLFNPALLGLALAAVALLTRFWFLMEETAEGTFSIAGFKLPAYSLVLAFTPLVLVALVRATGHIGLATLVGLLFLLTKELANLFVNWGIDTLASSNGVHLRDGLRDFGLIDHVYPVYMPLAGLLVDLVLLTGRNWWRQGARPWQNLAVAGGASLAGGVALFLLEKPWENYYNTIVNAYIKSNPLASALVLQQARARLPLPDYWQALPLVAVLAFVGGLVGTAVAASLRYTDR